MSAHAYKLISDSATVADKSIRELDLYFAQNGYDIYKNLPNASFMPEMDRIYTKNKFKEKIFFKIGIYVDEKNYNKIHAFQNGYLSNLIINGKSNVLFFTGYDADQVTTLKSNLNSVFRARSTWSFLFLPRAEASDRICEDQKGRSAQQGPDYGLVRTLVSIKNGLRDGAWNATGGAAESLVKTGLKIQQNRNDSVVTVTKFLYCNTPLTIENHLVKCQEWSDRIFSSSEREFTDFVRSILNVSKLFSEAWPEYNKLDSNQKTQFGVEFFSTIGFSGAIALGTGGMNSSASALQIYKIAAKIKLVNARYPPAFIAQLQSPVKPEAVLEALTKIDPKKARLLSGAGVEFLEASEVTFKKMLPFEDTRTAFDLFKRLSDRIKVNPNIVTSLNTQDKILLNTFLGREQKEISALINKFGSDYAKAKETEEKLFAAFNSRLEESKKIIKDSGLSVAEKQKVAAYFALQSCRGISNSVESSEETKQSNGRIITVQ